MIYDGAASGPKPRRVFLTGVGAVTPLARGAGATMDQLVAGACGVGALTLFELVNPRARVAAEVAGLVVADVAPPARAEAWSRTDALALLAAREALASAGLDARAHATRLVVGGSTTGMFENELPLAAMSRGGPISPLASAASHPLSATADRLREAIDGLGPAATVCSACSSGANALVVAATWIRLGLADRVLAGGADGLCRLTYAGFGALGALAPGPSKPFDAKRAGLNLGEGAAFVVLESEAAAKARGAEPIAELAGWFAASEAHHITNPEPSGAAAARVIAEALARAGVAPSELGYVNAHGTATPLNDAMETRAIHAALGASGERVAVSSSKGQIGHTLAAAGAIEAVITALAVARGVLPPTVGLDEVDPACALDHVRVARRASIRAACSNSFGFGGGDTALVMTEPYAFAPAGTRRAQVVVTGAATAGPLGVGGPEQAPAYLEPGASPPGSIAIAFGDHLDLARARRLDRAARLVTVAAHRALASANLAGASHASIGAVIGTAFANVDASLAFIRRLVDKGASLVSPAEFPNLVPSSPAGHAAIYLGLRGPVVATADVGATGEAAIVLGVDLVAAGEARAIVAGAIEEATAMIDGCIGVVASTPRGVRSEGAAAIVLEAEQSARARGAVILAHVDWCGRCVDARAALEAAPPPRGRAALVSSRDEHALAAAAAGTAWADVPRELVAARAGEHESAGAFAAAAAVAAIAQGRLDHAVVLADAGGRGVALSFTRAGAP